MNKGSKPRSTESTPKNGSIVESLKEQRKVTTKVAKNIEEAKELCSKAVK